MNKGKAAIIILSVLLFSLSFQSCKTTKKTLKKPLKERGFEFLYSKMKENQISTDYFNSRLSLVYMQQGKSKTALNGQIRIKTDSIIWLSISPALGIEALRVEMTRDSFKVINRLNKTYLTGDFNMVEKLINTTIDYSVIESMLFANDLSHYDVKKYKVKVDNGLYHIAIKKRRKIRKYLRKHESKPQVLVQNFWIDPNTYRIKKMEINEFGDDSKKLIVYYDEYRNIEGKRIPTKILLEINAGTDIRIDLKYKKPEFDKPLRFPFKVPSKYKLMDISAQ